MPPLRGLVFGGTRCYKHAVPTGLKTLKMRKLLKSAKSVSSAIIRDSDELVSISTQKPRVNPTAAIIL